MRVLRRVLVVALACLSNFLFSTFCLSGSAAAQQSGQVIAEHVLGPQWKQLSRRAGMIFAGTVLTTAPQTVANQAAAAAQVFPPATQAVRLSFRVDHAIAGVERGQILTIHEWAGARSMHRPMSKGQHILIFLYPPSRLGFTSPVGGSLGQVALDPAGKNVSKYQQRPTADVGLRNELSTRPRVPGDTGIVSIVQLERAIRSAREE